MNRPNILFLFSDQQRWDTVSCYGQPLGAHFGLTPHLDALAREGTRFDSAITCQPVCGPARACIQTGKYPSQIGCQVNDLPLPASEKGIAHYMNEAGYETAYVGKWHLASRHTYPKSRGEDTVDYTVTAIPPALRGGYRDYWVASDVLEFTSHGYGGYMYDQDGNRRDFDGYRADATTDFALEYLKRPKEKPFFLFVSYIEPHHQNDRNRFEGPEGSRERFRDYPVPGDLAGREGDWREQLPDYLGCCKSLDDNVGRIVAALKELGIYDNTVIFYTSDHGCHFRTRNGEYKRSCHDSSVHIPLIAKGPGFDGGHVVRELVSLIDFAPSLLAAAGIPKPEQMRGEAIQRLTAEPGSSIHDQVFIQISESCTGRAIRTREYTYSVEATADTPYEAAGSSLYRERELYDLRSDPCQQHNLVRDPRYQEIRGQLRERLADCILREEGMAVQILPAAPEAGRA